MPSAKTTSNIILIIATIFAAAACFQTNNLNLYSDKNFILSNILVIDDPQICINELRWTFDSLGLNFPNTSSLATLLNSVINAGKKEFNTHSGRDGNQVADSAAQLTAILNSNNGLIIGNFNNNKEYQKEIPMNGFRNELIKFFREHFKAAILKTVQESEADMETLNVELLNDKHVRTAVEQFQEKLGSAAQIDMNKLWDYITKIMKQVIYNNEELLAQYFTFKNNAVDALYDFLHMVFNGLNRGDIKWTKNTVKKLKSLFDLVDRLEKGKTLKTLEQFSIIGSKYVFPYINEVNKDQYLPLVKVLFSFFDTNFNNDVCKLGKTMFLNYIFKSDVVPQESNHREFILKSMYNRILKVSNISSGILRFDTKEDLVFNADLVWNTVECTLAHKDYKNMIANIDKYYNFDATYIEYLSMGDAYFNIHPNILKDYKEIYTALYNVFLLQSVKLVNRKLNYLYFVESTEAFITLAKVEDHQFDRFDINIDEFYVIFKLINMQQNLGYFAQHDNVFLRFDAPEHYAVVEFVDTLSDIKSILKDWYKKTEAAQKLQVFSLASLSEQTISKVIVNKAVLTSQLYM